jgi:hypothetical protein
MEDFDQFAPKWLPDGPLSALSRTILVAVNPSPDGEFIESWVTADGQPIVCHLLNGKPKVILCPWYGDIDKDPLKFDPSAGDGRPIYAEPDSDFFCATPNWPPRNIRTGVPLWLLQSPSPSALEAGVATVLAVGLLHPVLTAATMDIYRGGKRTARNFYHDPRIEHDELMRQRSGWISEQLAEYDCMPGVPVESTPTWRPRCAGLLR